MCNGNGNTCKYNIDKHFCLLCVFPESGLAPADICHLCSIPCVDAMSWPLYNVALTSVSHVPVVTGSDFTTTGLVPCIFWIAFIHRISAGYGIHLSYLRWVFWQLNSLPYVPSILYSPFYYLLICVNTTGLVEIKVDPNRTPHYVVPDLCQYRLLIHCLRVCPYT